MRYSIENYCANPLLNVQEQQAFGLLIALLAIKYIKRQSMQSFTSDAFLFAKGIVALLAFYADIRVFAHYVVIFLGEKRVIHVDYNHFLACLSCS